MNLMLTGEETAPSFMRPACPGKVLQVYMELNSNVTSVL